MTIFSFKNPTTFENSKKRLKSHMCYKKSRMHHGGEGPYRLVCFQYLFPAPATHSPATRTENSHSSIKSLFSPLVHNILLYWRIRAINHEGIMKKSARAHSALVLNRQFHARIARKVCGHFNEIGRKYILHLLYLSFKIIKFHISFYKK